MQYEQFQVKSKRNSLQIFQHIALKIKLFAFLKIHLDKFIVWHDISINIYH